MHNEVVCDVCGNVFLPEIIRRQEDEIEFTYFRCDNCGKTYTVSVTDEALRADVEHYVDLAEQARKGALTDEEYQLARSLMKSNVMRSRELKKLYAEGEAQ